MFGSVVWSAALIALCGVLIVLVAVIGIAHAERRGRLRASRRPSAAARGRADRRWEDTGPSHRGRRA